MDSSPDWGATPDAPGDWAQRLAERTLAASRPPSTEPLPLPMVARRSWAVPVASRAAAAPGDEDASSGSPLGGEEEVRGRPATATGGAPAPLGLSPRTRWAGLPAGEGIAPPPARGPSPGLEPFATTEGRPLQRAPLADEAGHAARPPSVSGAVGLSAEPPARLRVVTDEALQVADRPARVGGMPAFGGEEGEPAARLAIEPAETDEALAERLARRARLDAHR